jgi:Cu+-exporting ATPase
MWNALTAVLIVACPCALLLCNTFTNGNILRILSNRKFYLRNAQTIEDIANTNLIVFDKTGTLTTGSFFDIQYDGKPLTEDIKQKIGLLASQSVHPMSKSIAALYQQKSKKEVVAFTETPGKGIEGIIDGDLITLGSRKYVTGMQYDEFDTAVYVSIEGTLIGKFSFKNHYRKNIAELIQRLQKHYPIAILSGDNEGEKRYLELLLGENAEIYFNQKPEDKLAFIKDKQAQGFKVMMIGDGLNDAGALKQADAGISVTEDSNNFTPASDAILEAKEINNLGRFVRFCKANGLIIMFAFVISILYNIIGIYFAVTGQLSPMIAAILMPASSISILLITFGLSNLLSRKIFGK